MAKSKTKSLFVPRPKGKSAQSVPILATWRSHRWFNAPAATALIIELLGAQRDFVPARFAARLSYSDEKFQIDDFAATALYLYSTSAQPATLDLAGTILHIGRERGRGFFATSLYLALLQRAASKLDANDDDGKKEISEKIQAVLCEHADCLDRGGELRFLCDAQAREAIKIHWALRRYQIEDQIYRDMIGEGAIQDGAIDPFTIARVEMRANAVCDEEFRNTRDREVKNHPAFASLFVDAGDDDKAPPPKDVPIIEPGPTLQIVKEIGDPKGREGDAIVKAYKGLIEPLALHGAGIDIDHLESALAGEFPWMGAAIERIIGDFRLRRHAGLSWLRFRPILLVGPPGVGKTRFARRLAELMGVGVGDISAAGSNDNRMLAGTARGWHSCQPAYPLLVALRSGCANPIIVVDEIDKARGDGRNGDVKATLLTLLEAETARVFFDEALLARCDLSQVSWILTANASHSLPTPLLSRLAVVPVGLPQPEDFDAIIESILRDLAGELGATPADLPALEPEIREALRAEFVKGRTVREIKNAVSAALSIGADGVRICH